MRKSKTSEYKIWQSMKQRCYNSNLKAYKHYGGRGICVCDRWLNSFENFSQDMGLRPSISHQIDRTDNDGNYEPGNCEWSTNTENSNNRSNSKWWYINGSKFNSLHDAAKVYNTPIRELRKLCDKRMLGCYSEQKYPWSLK